MIKMMKKTYKHTFTLVELLAAMAVFSVLLVVAMQLFSGAQRIWLRAEQKTSTFSDARTAMEFISSRVQTLVYSTDYPFEIAKRRITSYNNGQIKDSFFNTFKYHIWFATGMPMTNRDGDNDSRRFVKFDLNVAKIDESEINRSEYYSEPGVLRMTVYSKADNPRLDLLFPPYDGNTYADSNEKATTKINGKFKEFLAEENDAGEVDKSKLDKYKKYVNDGKVVELMKNVTAFKIMSFPAVPKNKTEWKIDPDEKLLDDSNTNVTLKSPPYYLEIEISLIDNDDKFQQWLDVAGTDADAQNKRDAIFAEYGYTFRRAVLIGQRSAEE